MDSLKRNKMDLVYYYPSEHTSPANVGRNILENILINYENLPFDAVKVYCRKRDVAQVRNKFKDLDVICYKDLSKISPNTLVHIPVSLTVFPNSKFLLFLYCKIIKKTKIFVQYHGDIRSELRHNLRNISSFFHIFTYLLTPYLLRKADSVITHSYFMENIIKKYGVNNCVVIPNAIDTYWFEPIDIKNESIKADIVKNNFNIFYHGRLSWEKGVDLLIEALKLCLKEKTNVMLYIAGTGSQKKYLEHLCLKLGISKNFVFLGNLDPVSIKYFLKNVDLAIYPSRFDNFPLSILEALACAKCPVYFSKKAGIYDFVIKDGITLNFFEPTISEILNIIFMSCKLDSGSNEKISFYQKEFAKKYTWNSVASQYIQLYNEFETK